MKRFRVILLFSVAILLSSCSKVIMLAWGMSNPKDESYKKQQTYLLKHGLDTANLFTATSQFAHSFVDNVFPMFKDDSSGVKAIQSRIYDKDGNALVHWASCYGDINQAVHNGEFVSIYGTPDCSLLLTKYVTMVDRGADIEKLINKNYENYFVSFWGTYLGKPSEPRLFFLDSLAQANPAKYVHIKINMGDFGAELEK